MGIIHFLCSNRDLWFLSTYDNLLYYCRDYFCADCLENRLYEWKDTYNQLYYLHGFSSIQWNIYSFPVFLKTNAIIMLIVVGLCAFIGAIIAKKLLKKHFQKAGMV